MAEIEWMFQNPTHAKIPVFIHDVLPSLLVWEMRKYTWIWVCVCAHVVRYRLFNLKQDSVLPNYILQSPKQTTYTVIPSLYIYTSNYKLPTHLFQIIDIAQTSKVGLGHGKERKWIQARPEYVGDMTLVQILHSSSSRLLLLIGGGGGRR